LKKINDGVGVDDQLEWYEYLSPHTFTGVLTFISIFTLGVIAHIKVYSPKEDSIKLDEDNHFVH
jgi:hypothetical protein